MIRNSCYENYGDFIRNVPIILSFIIFYENPITFVTRISDRSVIAYATYNYNTSVQHFFTVKFPKTLALLTN